MIKFWTLENFKSVCGQTTIEMRPLTIFVGPNSSGKSTVLQSILLTAQTLHSPVHSRSIILNGHIVRLGTFTDIVSNNHENEQILVGFELKPTFETLKDAYQMLSPEARNWNPYSREYGHAISSINCRFTFSSNGVGNKQDILQLQPRLDECIIKTTAEGQGPFSEEEIHIKRSDIPIMERMAEYGLPEKSIYRAEIGSLEYRVVKPLNIKRVKRYYKYPIAGKLAGVVLRHFVPTQISMVFDAVEEHSRMLTEAFIMLENYRYRDIKVDPEATSDSFISIISKTAEDFFKEIDIANLPTRIPRIQSSLKRLLDDFSLSNLRDYYIHIPPHLRRVFSERLAEKYNELKEAARAGRKPERSITYVPLPEMTEFAVSFIEVFFTRYVKYLGPLRDEPKPVYPLSGATDPKDVGFRGEHTAAVLDVNRDAVIYYISPNIFESGINSPEPKPGTLLEAVLEWLHYMGVASNVDTSDKGKLGHELKVSTPDEVSLHDLTHVGVGVSQVLPILVLSLLAERGSVLIFEQPELHLHPKVQSRLADFFLTLSMLDKQCIVETHSEYLINKLRLHAALSSGSTIADNVMIYFTEKAQGYSAYRQIRINEYGKISEWPVGFFDENETIVSNILLAALNKQKEPK